MNQRRRTAIVIVVIALLALLLAACEMPSPSTGDIQSIPEAGTGEVMEGEPQEPSDESQAAYPPAGETAGETGGEEQPAGEAPAAGEETAAGEEATATEEAASPRPEDEQPAAEEGEQAGEESTAGETAAESPPAEGEAGEEAAPAEETAAEEPAAPAEAETTAETTTPAEIPANGIHVVQPGETLYQIGLKYGYSWIVLAQYNNLYNANAIQAGQELRIPPRPDTQPEPLPTPVPNATDETLYTVRPGDNLFLIGLRYGIDWPQIAEANGLVNPNQILVGQTLKIPTSQPGGAPEFNHVVKRGETLFLIALRYGVSWPAIAEKNSLQAPYVIYPDQTLIIPASQ